MRVDYQIMLAHEDPEPLLRAWQGRDVVLWGFTPSHRVLELRMFGPNGAQLQIQCAEVDFIKTPTRWSKSNLQYKVHSERSVTLSDSAASFEVKAEVIAVREIAERA